MEKKIFFILFIIFNTTALVSMDNSKEYRLAAEKFFEYPLESNDPAQNIIHIAGRASFGYPDAQLQLAQHWLDQGDHETAHQWLCRYHIRIMQDIACSAHPKLFMHLRHSPRSIAEQIVLSPNTRKKQFIQQLTIVKKQIESELIPAPTWLTKDCKDPYTWDKIRTLIISFFFTTLPPEKQEQIKNQHKRGKSL